jgi:hypothetical protein
MGIITDGYEVNDFKEKIAETIPEEIEIRIETKELEEI